MAVGGIVLRHRVVRLEHGDVVPHLLEIGALQLKFHVVHMGSECRLAGLDGTYLVGEVRQRMPEPHDAGEDEPLYHVEHAGLKHCVTA